MPKSVDSIVAYCNEILPNRLQTTTIVTFLDEAFKTIRHYTPDTTNWTTQTVSSQAQYTLPNNINVRDILQFHISNTTYNSTTVVSSTLCWDEYNFVGYRDYYKARSYRRATTNNSTTYAERIVINPIPTDVIYIKVLHWDYPVTSDSTTIIKNDFMVDYLQSKTLAKIAKTGHHPRIDLANNYELDAEEALMKLKRERSHVENELAPRHLSYKEWWR